MKELCSSCGNDKLAKGANVCIDCKDKILLELFSAFPPHVPDLFEYMNVHTTNCCKKHGCKFGDKSCPIINMYATQIQPCEKC
jgi:hypothetical protein